MRVVSWFSCGAASAVAAKLAVEKHGADCVVVYCDTMKTEHPDNSRFLADIERWIGRTIEVVGSSRYQTVDEVFEKTRFMSGPKGARCTVEMKKLPREVFQRPTDTHVFGYTFDEQWRAESFEQQNPALSVEWILIDQFVRKVDCHRLLRDAGIAPPAMYALGFDHNNCLGCVKAQSPGYWNRTRRLFPEVFERRARQSRLLGVRLALVGQVDGKNVRCFLDELPPDAGGPDDAIDCGPACQVPMNFSES